MSFKDFILENDEYNYVVTGGQFGRRRRLPGFTISKMDNGRFIVHKDSDGTWVSSGHKTPEDAEKENKWRIR